MYSRVMFNDFVDAFSGHDRKEQFSYEALKALFDYYEELEQSTGEEIELDVIAICCEWTEYDNTEAAAEAYVVEPEELADNTTIIELKGGGVVVQNF